MHALLSVSVRNRLRACTHVAYRMLTVKIWPTDKYRVMVRLKRPIREMKMSRCKASQESQSHSTAVNARLSVACSYLFGLQGDTKCRIYGILFEGNFRP